MLALLAAVLLQAYAIQTFYVVEIDGVIGPYTFSQIQRVISLAEQNNGAVILSLYTPGGLADVTLQIMKEIGNSPVPVVGFVYPDYGYAWSAGTYILMSTHIAAMAPHTVIGSCQPIAGGAPINESKTLNALIGYLETVSKSYGRNETFARLCIQRNLNLDAESALRYRVIDLLATDINDLIEKIDGRTILLRGRAVELVVKGRRVEKVSPTLVEKFQMWISDPLISTILSTLAFLLLLVAFFTGNPIAAVVAILILTISMFSILPTAWMGLILVILGAVLILAEVLTGGATYGALAVVGAIFLGVGFISTYPINVFSGELIYIKNWWLIMTGLYINIAVLVGFLIFMVYKVISIHRRKPPSEFLTNLRGVEGVAIDDIGPDKLGFVIVFGEYWKATSKTPIGRGCKVRVVEIEGDILVVELVKC